MFNKILVPLDGSELSEQTLPLAENLAKAVQGEIILLRGVIPVYLSAPVMAEEYDWQWPMYSREQMRREVRHYLRDIEDNWQGPDRAMRSVVMEGDAASVIVDTAVNESVDLIIMSSHGWSGRSRWSLGGVTERVLHMAPCPVLVVRALEPIEHIMIALDGSELAQESVSPGLEIARRLNAQVTLFRANEPASLEQPWPFVMEWEQSEAGRRWQARTREEASFYLEDMRQDVAKGVDVETAVLDGSTVDMTLAFAQENGVQLIVMTTHGRTGLRRWLYGSVTAKVLRQSNCSMLIIRPPDASLN